MASTPQKDVSSNRKRPHVALEYEGGSHSSEGKDSVVRVKQEYYNPWQYVEQPHHNSMSSPHVKLESLPQDYLLYYNHHGGYDYSTHTTVQRPFIQSATQQSSPSCSYQSYYNASPQPVSQYNQLPTIINGGTTFGSLLGMSQPSELDRLPTSDEPDKNDIISRGKSPRRISRIKRELESDDGWEPPLWRQQLQNITKMRESRNAPVDIMGAHKNAEQTTHVTPKVRRYQVLVSLMLSSQTKDQITAQAMKALKNHGLTIENIINTSEEDIAKLIHPVGFWRKKAGYIKRVSQILLDKYEGDIPTTMDQLCSLPGVGPKMSHLVMDIAWDNISGIAVDTHVHRISHRLGWMRKDTENTEITRICLEKWLPKSEWRELNWLLVGFGQQRCLPTTPKCQGCLNEDICPASKLKGGGPWGKKKKTVTVKKENS